MTLTEVRLCIPCWYLECGGRHLFPDHYCPCCMGLTPVEGERVDPS